MSMPRSIVCVLCLAFAIGCQEETAKPQEEPWQLFVDALAEAGHLIESSYTPQDELTRAEGLRYLGLLIAEGIRTNVEGMDPGRPLLAAKLLSGGDTSDARYFDAMIDGSHSYRVHGERGEAPLIEFSVYDGKIGVHGRSKRVGFLLEEALDVAPDGTFEVFFSPDPRPGNWIRTTPETKYLLIRQYSHDWRATRGATLHIEALDAPPPSALEEHEIRDGLLAAARFVKGVAIHWAGTVAKIRLFPENSVVRVPPWIGETLPAGHRFAVGPFELEVDEALIVEFVAPEAPYWSFQLANYWFEPIDRGGEGSHLNNRSAVVEADGSVRLVIADVDPGACNWLDTRGHRVGVMVFRLSRSEDLVLPPFDARVVKAAEVEAAADCDGGAS
jgi:hypothetical protein